MQMVRNIEQRILSVLSPNWYALKRHSLRTNEASCFITGYVSERNQRPKAKLLHEEGSPTDRICPPHSADRGKKSKDIFQDFNFLSRGPLSTPQSPITVTMAEEEEEECIRGVE